MAYFAKVIDGIVTKVIVAEQDFIDNYFDGERDNGFKLLTIQKEVSIY